MAFVGLILALAAAVLLWSRWSPVHGPSEAPQTRPTQTLDDAREAAEQFGAQQQQRADQVNQLE